MRAKIWQVEKNRIRFEAISGYTTNKQHHLNMKRLHNKCSITTYLLVIFWMASSVTARSQSSDHTCGATQIHNAAVTYGQVADIDGNAYKTVIIDDLVWFAENLKVTRFQNGDLIPHVSDSAAWSVLTGPGMCSYQNDISYDCPYGKLYNFFVASDLRNPCPNGWRVPSLTDFNKLINYFDPMANGGAPSNLPNAAGGPLKSDGFSYWQQPNTNATNASGFSAIPNGGRNNAGVFSFTNNSAASYWYASPLGPGMGFFLQLPYNQEFAVRNAYFTKYGCCIRCVTDVSTVRVDELENPRISIFPNPARHNIQIHSDKQMIGAAYTIADLTGRLVLSGKISSEVTSVSIVELPSGMYFLHFPETNLGVTKIIKE